MRRFELLFPHGPSSNETWVVEFGGEVVEKRAQSGAGSLTTRERLVDWLWWADYMMRNAGDFENAVGDEPDFQREIALCAKSLGFTYTEATFSLSRDQLIGQYFDRFERVCDEVRRGNLA